LMPIRLEDDDLFEKVKDGEKKNFTTSDKIIFRYPTVQTY